MIADTGACRVGVESSVILCVDGAPATLLRPGGISAAQLEAVLGRPLAPRRHGRQRPQLSGHDDQTIMRPLSLCVSMQQRFSKGKPFWLLGWICPPMLIVLWRLSIYRKQAATVLKPRRSCLPPCGRLIAPMLPASPLPPSATKGWVRQSMTGSNARQPDAQAGISP